MQGSDNRTFRLGDELAVRLPSHARYAAQVEKEQAWLPRLAPGLPLPVPAPVALGEPDAGYPWRWSVNRWLAGEPALSAEIADLTRFARSLAAFLDALQRLDAAGGPTAGQHSFWRGGPLATYDRETQRAIAVLQDRVDARGAAEVWRAAMAAAWAGPPAWVHGDVAAGNLLVRDGRLAAVIDFGCCAVGDPACDLVIAWTMLAGESREAFRAGLPLDAGCWARGRGWALWKALIMLAKAPRVDLASANQVERIIADVIADHRAAG